MFNKLKQIKDLREQAKNIQGKLSQEIVQVDSHWGKLKFSLNGNMEGLSLEIDPQLLDKNNHESLQKELLDLFNDGMKKMQRSVAQKMAKDGGLPNLSDFLKK